MTLPRPYLTPREIAPPSHREWAAQEIDKGAEWNEIFEKWTTFVGAFFRVAKKRLYDNSDFTELDLRFHRHGAATLICDGEALVVNGGTLVQEEIIDAEEMRLRIEIIDRSLAKLTRALHQWHGAIEDQADIPESFKSGIRDLEQGKVVDFDKAIKDKP